MLLPPQVNFLSFDDDDWANIYPNKVACSAATQLARSSVLMPNPPGAPVTATYTESQRPHFWFFAMANGASCSPAVYLDYTVTALQADGGQLSYDEIGMPSAYGCFFALYLIGLAVHIYFHYVRRPRFAPLLVLLLTWSLVLSLLSLLCHTIDWANVSSKGVNIPFFSVVGGLLRIAASMTLWCMAGLAANGFGITTYSLGAKENIRGLGLTAGALVTYLALIIYYSVSRDPASTSALGGAWPAIVLLGVTLAFMGWFIFRIRATLLGETHTLKRKVLAQLAYTLGSQFLVRSSFKGKRGGMGTLIH